MGFMNKWKSKNIVYQKEKKNTHDCFVTLLDDVTNQWVDNIIIISLANIVTWPEKLKNKTYRD